jgi:hypothetical protein
VRYTPDTATQDLMLYASGLEEAKVTSFADDNWSNRECIDVCGEAATDENESGGEDDGGDGGSGGSDASGSEAPASDSSSSKGSGCSTVVGGGSLAAMLLGSWLVALRRRDD